MTPEELSKLIEKWEDERISMTKNITPRRIDSPPTTLHGMVYRGLRC